METVNHECYVSLEVAKLLKEAGFDWKCKLYFSELINAPKEAGIFDAMTNKVYGVFDSTIPGIGNPTEDDILRPTTDVAQRWLREVKGVEIEVQRYESPHPVARELFETLYDKVVKRKFAYSVNVLDENDESLYDEQDFYTYESALEAGIKKALEIILGKGE